MTISPKAVELAESLRMDLGQLWPKRGEKEIVVQCAIERAISHGKSSCDACALNDAIENAITISSTRTEPKHQPAKWPFD